MYRSSANGLGAAPTCITDAERAEAASKCSPFTQIRGLGAMVSLAPMAGRLSAYAACDVMNLPTCPRTHAPIPLEPGAPGGGTRTLPPSAPPATPPATPPEFAPPEGGSSSSSTMGIFSILALVAAAGGGFYLYRKYKR